MELAKTFKSLYTRLKKKPIETAGVQRVTMIVGMHRSGTSFLTGSLQQAGLELGKHSAWNPHNLKGNRENGDIVALNDTVLAAHGYSWDSPPVGTLAWHPEHLDAARSIIDSYSGVPHWGFKDPRTILVLDGWRQLLPDIQFVGIFRHPEAVARSLDARGGMPREQAWLLWENYNHRLLSLHRQKPFPVLSFDEPPDLLLPKLDRVINQLGLKSSIAAGGDNAFFSAELKHHSPKEVDIPPHLSSLLDQLKAIAQ